MKATHEQIIKINQSMGYKVCEQYPDMKVTVMFNGVDYKTIIRATWKNGKQLPF